ncbi:hypothetical protein ACFYZT_29120 [Streptomyces sp. NPDC001591]|uniref:hypothetical protein n=1 Tax=unclassified Streptomyces TaxID=2593676 RepID=UPI0033D93330
MRPPRCTSGTLLSPATTRASLFDGVRTVLAVDAALVVVAALLVAAGLRRRRA